MIIEKIEKEVTRAKLTISNDRISLKFPIGFSDENKTKLESFTKRISNEFKPEQTYRGKFDELGITLMNGSNKDKHRFNF